MRRTYAFRLLLPISLVDLLTLAALVTLAGTQGEANPVMALALGGGLIGAVLIKGLALVAVGAFEAYASWDFRPAWGRRLARIAAIPLSIGVYLNIWSLVAVAAARGAA